MIDLAQEVRVLNAATDLIESAVNYCVCCFYKDQDGLVTEVKPKGSIEGKYFFVLLLELFTDVNKELIPGKLDSDNLLTIICRISQCPQLSSNVSSARRLQVRSKEFLDWLEHEFAYDIYSENINKNVHVEICRKKVLYLVGNRCKHTLVRSNVIVQKLVKQYRDSGIKIAVDAEILLLSDIDNWLLQDVCAYHFTKICELCSNLYHAIVEYVRPEYEIRLRRKDGIAYLYEIPSTLTRSDSISEFYELFNKVRNPWVPIIQTNRMLTLRY